MRHEVACGPVDERCITWIDYHVNARELRIRAGLSLIQGAVLADVAEATIRVYESSRDGVGPRSRAKLDAFYLRLSRTVTSTRPQAAPLAERRES